MSYNSLKNFSNFLGLDLSASDLTRNAAYSSDNMNADIAKTGALVKKTGFQYITDSIGGSGTGIFKNMNITTGAVTEVPVCVDSNLYTLVDDSFTITYSGSNTSLLNIYVDEDTNEFTLTIDENTVNILTQDLKVGINESSSTSIATVISAIDALADYAATGGTITTGSAAFLDLQYATQLSATAVTISFKRWQQVNNSKATPLSVTQTHRDDSDFENASFANLNNNLYISTGYDNLMKYDGQTFYRAGMPQPVDITSHTDSATGSSHPNTDTFYYMMTYEQKDNKGNLVEGIRSSYSTLHTMAATKDVNVVVSNIVASTGFNTNCGTVNGLQTSVTTITVNSSHTLNVSDTAYFYDSVSASYVERNITAKSATTITIAGAAVTVASGAVISNNLRINLYRTKTAPVNAETASYYLVAAYPNNSLSAAQTLVDSTTDANLGFEYIAPVKLHGLPPMGRYNTTYRNQLFISGVPTDANSVFYSDIDSPEYFPAGDNSWLVDAFEGTKVRGLGALDTAVITFKDLSIQAITGDISSDDFRVDEISYGGIGCLAHGSIQKIKGALFFISRAGIYRVTLQGIDNVGKRIQPDFTKLGTTFNLQKCTSANYIRENKYILFVPTQAADGSGHVYATDDSLCYTYDHKWDAWFKWDSINAQAGFAYQSTSGTLFFQSRRLDSDSAATEFQTARFNSYGNLNDYSHHEQPIEFSYSTHWEDLGDPAVFKKFLRLKVFALGSDVISGDASLYALTINQEINFGTPAPIAIFDMDFSGGSLGYDGAGWDASPWGDAPLTELKGKLKSSKCRSMRLIFSNDMIRQGVLISGYEVLAATPYKLDYKE